ncbi:MAG: hypothetical protein ACLPHP_01290 [Candidatus Sulfotelmatobacter sp.]
MNRYGFVASAVLGLAVCMCGSLSAQQAPADDGIPVHILVTAEPRHGSEVPEVKREDVMVFEGKTRDKVTEWIPAQGDRAGLELFILLDDASSSSLGTQLDDIRKFIAAQPASTKVGVAYMQDGIGRIVQNPTTDHDQAAKALRLPIGMAGINGSPYFSVSDLIKRWPVSTDRREILMVSDGIDPYYGGHDTSDPYLEAAIDDAQRASIVVSAIYTPGAGHFGHSYWQTYWGQLYLAQLTDSTGGESYDIGFAGPPVSFSPYLEDLGRRLTHQYFLTFLAKPPKKAGWQRIKLRSEVSSVDLVTADKVWVSPEGK